MCSTFQVWTFDYIDVAGFGGIRLPFDRFDARNLLDEDIRVDI